MPISIFLVKVEYSNRSYIFLEIISLSNIAQVWSNVKYTPKYPNVYCAYFRKKYNQNRHQ